jgi:hypothetical protein
VQQLSAAYATAMQHTKTNTMLFILTAFILTAQYWYALSSSKSFVSPALTT